MSAFTMYNIATTYHIGFSRALLISKWQTMTIHYKPSLVATLENIRVTQQASRDDVSWNKTYKKYRIAGYFRGGKFSRMPSIAIIHEENFHECMAVTLTSAISQGKFSRIKLNSQKFSPSKITRYTVVVWLRETNHPCVANATK